MTLASPMMTSAAIVDVLSGLLDAEQGSIFAFMDAGSAYLSRATVEVRQKVETIAAANRRRVGELCRVVDQLGGNVRVTPLSPESQYMAYLSMKFLVPKLIEAKRQSIERYQNAKRALPDAPDDLKDLIERHLSESEAELAALNATSKQG